MNLHDLLCLFSLCLCRKVEAFVAEDGKQYIFDTEAKKWITPEDKIEEDLEALREAVGETKADHEAAQELKKKKQQLKQQSNSNKGKANSNNAAAQETKSAAESKDTAVLSTNGSTEASDAPGAATTEGAEPSASENGNSNNADEKKRKRKKKKNSEKWRKSKNRTWVYVNGLPLDVTVQEVHDHFAKCGVVQQDLVAGAPRIKLYQNKEFGGLNVRVRICLLVALL